MAKSRLNNILQMIGDYANVKRRGTKDVGAPARLPQKAIARSMMSSRANYLDTDVPVVPTRGNDHSLFEITDAAKKSVSRYNNRRIRRDRENEPVAFRNVLNVAINRMPQTSRGTKEVYANFNSDATNAFPMYTYTRNALGASPRRLMNEKRVAQRYANADMVERKLQSAKQTAMKLAPWLGATIGGATAVNAMRNKQSSGSMGKRMSKRQAGPKPNMNKYFN